MQSHYLQVSSTHMFTQSHVEDNGNLLLVADQNTLRDDLLQLDLEAAHQRTQLSNSWREQVKYIATSCIVAAVCLCRSMDC